MVLAYCLVPSIDERVKVEGVCCKMYAGSDLQLDSTGGGETQYRVSTVLLLRLGFMPVPLLRLGRSPGSCKRQELSLCSLYAFVRARYPPHSW